MGVLNVRSGSDLLLEYEDSEAAKPSESYPENETPEDLPAEISVIISDYLS